MSDQLIGGGKPSASKVSLQNVSVKQRNISIVMFVIAGFLLTFFFIFNDASSDTENLTSDVGAPAHLQVADNDDDSLIQEMVANKNAKEALGADNFSPVMVGKLKEFVEEDVTPKDTGSCEECCEAVFQKYNLYDQNGNPISIFDQYGNIVGVGASKDGLSRLFSRNGKPVPSDNQLYDKDGNPLGMYGKDNTRMLYDKEGNPIMVYDKDGRPIFDKTGNRIFYDEQGNVVDREGRPVLDPDGNRIYYDRDGVAVDKDGNALFDSHGNVLYYDKNGNPVDANGNRLVGANGEPLHYDKDGRLVNARGELVDRSGTVLRTDKNGNPIGANGERLYFDKNGNLVDKNGNPVDANGNRLVGANGEPLHYDKDGRLVNARGELVDRSGTVLRTDKNGNPIGANGERLYFDKNGNLVDKNGNPVDANGNRLVGANGEPLHYDKDGRLVNARGELVRLDKNGNILGEDGRIKLTKDGKKVFYDKDGNPVDKFGNQLYFDKDGNLVAVSKPVVTDPYVKGGVLYDKDGKPLMVLDKDGNPVSVFDKNGNAQAVGANASSDKSAPDGIGAYSPDDNKTDKIGFAGALDPITRELTPAQQKKERDALRKSEQKSRSAEKAAVLAMMSQLQSSWIDGGLPTIIEFQAKDIPLSSADPALAPALATGEADAAGADAVELEPIYIQAGEVYYAYNSLEVNSDYAGPVLLRGLDPKIKDMKFLADGFTLLQDALTISPTRMIAPDISIPISAYVLNPATDATVVASEVDYHYFERWGSFLLVEGLAAYKNLLTFMQRPTDVQAPIAPAAAAALVAPVAVVPVTGSALADPVVIQSLLDVNVAATNNNAAAAVAAYDRAIAAAASAAATATVGAANTAAASAAAANDPTVLAQRSVVQQSATPALSVTATAAANQGVAAAAGVGAAQAASVANNAANATYNAVAATAGIATAVNAINKPTFSLTEQGWVVAGNLIDQVRPTVAANINRPHTVFLHRNEPVAILFMEDVRYDPNKKRK